MSRADMGNFPDHFHILIKDILRRRRLVRDLRGLGIYFRLSLVGGRDHNPLVMTLCLHTHLLSICYPHPSPHCCKNRSEIWKCHLPTSNSLLSFWHPDSWLPLLRKFHGVLLDEQLPLDHTLLYCMVNFYKFYHLGF